MTDAALDNPPAAPAVRSRTIRVALAGNPNSGKTTLFNALTGMSQKTANFAGVTVERKTGRLVDPASGQTYEIMDLPGLYSMVPRSLDEKIAAEILDQSGMRDHTPDIVVVVADATNLQRSLYLCTQIADLGYPLVLALNMMDLAVKQGLQINVDGLSRRLGIPIVPMSAKKKDGVIALRRALFDLSADDAAAGVSVTEGSSVQLARLCQPLVQWLQQSGARSESGAFSEALRLISHPEIAARWRPRGDGPALDAALKEAREQFQDHGIPSSQAEVRIRYAAIDQICAQNIVNTHAGRSAISDRIDKVLTHRIFGPMAMLIILSTIFQSIYTWAELPMEAIENGVLWLGGVVEGLMPPGVLRDLLIDGVIAGVGAVLVFLPQIAFLFFFLAVLEDTGYLARVAFILDRFMAKIGLSGQSVIPLLSSFACAIPGVMATRTIQNSRDRMITIFVAPFMSCSARLPVYTIMIGAFIPSVWFGGVFYLPGLVLLAMYFLGTLVGVLTAALLRKWVVRGRPTNFIMELPVYRLPVWRFVFLRVYDAAKLFLVNAGRIILAVSIVLWFLASWPKPDAAAVGESGVQEQVEPEIRNSYAGKLGKFIEPAIEPLGFDWKIGIGLITSFAAREVIISTLATIYNIQEADEHSVDLRTALKRDTYPDGRPVFTPLVAISLMVFFVLACQCMSTLAVVRKETNSWRWPAFMFAYMLVLAYAGSFLVYQGGLLLGFS